MVTKVIPALLFWQATYTRGGDVTCGLWPFVNNEPFGIKNSSSIGIRWILHLHMPESVFSDSARDSKMKWWKFKTLKKINFFLFLWLVRKIMQKDEVQINLSDPVCNVFKESLEKCYAANKIFLSRESYWLWSLPRKNEEECMHANFN